MLRHLCRPDTFVMHIVFWFFFSTTGAFKNDCWLFWVLPLLKVWCSHTNFILGARYIGGDGALLLFGAQLPLPTALVGAYRWPVHGGRSLILWRKRQHTTKRDTVTVCAPDKEESGSILIYYPHSFRGFSGVCLWSLGVNVLGIYFVTAACLMIPLSKCVCSSIQEKIALMSRQTGTYAT